MVVWNHREEIWDYANAAVDYVQNQGVGAVALVDVAARPFALPLVHALNQRYGTTADNPRPAVFFLSPQGFLERESQGGRKIAIKSWIKGDGYEYHNQRRKAQDIVAAIPTELPGLYSHRNQPVLIMDSCMHTGTSVRPIIKHLKNAGFADLRTGVAHYEPKGTKVPVPDLVVSSEKPRGGCYPYGHDRMVSKTYQSLLAQQTQDPMRRALGVLLRKKLMEPL